MQDRKYGLYKRIMKHDPKAIDEVESLEEAKEIIKMMTGNVYLNGEIYQSYQFESKDVIMDTYNNLMKCPHCGEIIGNTADWTPNYCCECGKPLSGGNGKSPLI